MKSRLFFTFFCSCLGLSLFAQTSFVLVGRLVSDFSKDAIPNASIFILGGDQDVTDSQGGFELKVPPGKPGQVLRLLINDKEHGSHDYLHTLRQDAKQDLGDIPIKKNSKIIISGTVKDAKTKTFVDGLQISISSNKMTAAVPPKSTNQFGIFELIVPKAAFTTYTEYVDILIKDPKGRYADFSKTVNILAPLDIQLDNKPPNIHRKSTKVGGQKSMTINVKEGDLVKIKAVGQIKVGFWSGSSSPEGISGPFPNTEIYNIAKNFKHGALIYKLPGDAEWHLCGSACQFVANISGQLDLTLNVNDNDQGNNSGEYDVEVTVE